ncbi:MAG TPA: tRNA (adenosine(37)-N6)-dimethylallyltransferase MiaA [Candidatus Eremiobacteraceae bacterium]|nr:tRNA (adenosine(37)-N6)-dimethylallyltransferase MiaA [Candidatus Eremiobacteraceae bacterium]
MNDGPLMRALCICGPSASGKSDAAVAAAIDVGGEVVNADSRQIYAGMRIGTGWPPIDAMTNVPHHLFGIVPPAERYNAVRFVADARAVIARIVARGHLPIVVGGTGFYIEALSGSMPIDRPAGSEELRGRVLREAQSHSHETLREWLVVLDPAAASRVPRGDRYRTLRSIEAALAKRDQTEGAASYSSPSQRLHLTTLVLHVPRHELRARIARRVNEMFAAGLEEEAIGIRARWPLAPALTGIGYAEALSIADGTATRDEAIARCVLRTSQYAARQETWFRRFRTARIIEAGDAAAAASAVIVAAREITASK